ncbi:restriction endonuclease subunit S [Curtobacterium sp. MCLR17_034]|uniref:restriction endonuclease subunit S n=1 Tax=Curtobacterium sp. MCLR17_034 TaxID=2175623 RepID=UPI000DA8692F|nr:restriction endonuclease subunit S [Curtobacterium sp. MCLR17_034]PZF13243.1 restriction endonuclease subunit S [Curtobacterium sp. MCLR17_034]
MRIVRLSDVATVNPRGDRVRPEQSVSFVGMAQLDQVTAEATPLDSRKFSAVSKGYTVFRNRDLLVAKITPCFENGKIGRAILDEEIGVGSTEFHIVRPGPDVDDAYLLHFLRRREVRRSGELRMTGSGGQRRVPADFMRMLEVPLPPLDEQQRIAAILDQADTLRAKRRRILDHLGSVRKALLDELVASREDGKSIRLGDLAEVSSGITKGRVAKAPIAGSVPYLAVANVQDGRLELASVKSIDVTDAEMRRFRVLKGDLLLTEGGDPDKLGRGALWNDELPLALHQNHIFRVRLANESVVLRKYLSAYISSNAARAYFLRSAKQTTGIASINMTQLRDLQVWIPSMERQRQYVARLDALSKVAQDTALRSMDELFDSLVSRAFRGEL